MKEQAKNNTSRVPLPAAQNGIQSTGQSSAAWIQDNRPEAQVQLKLTQLAASGRKRAVIQLKKPRTVEEALKAEFASSSADPSYENLGAGPASDEFIVSGGQLASNHHIYPKSKLKTFAKALSKMQIAINTLHGKIDTTDYEFNGGEKARARSLYTKAKSLASKYGMESDGTQTLMGENFYWLPGNLFVGVNSGYRTDDPSNNEERVCPRSMNAGNFQAALEWGRATVAAASKIIPSDDFQSTYTELLEENIGLKNGLSRAMHKTNVRVGDDWVITGATTASEYLKKWGSGAKHYKLNATGANVYRQFEDADEKLAEKMTLTVRKNFTDDDFEALRQLVPNHAALQSMIPAYRKASSASESDPRKNLTNLDDIIIGLRSILDNSFTIPAQAATRTKYRDIANQLSADKTNFKNFL